MALRGQPPRRRLLQVSNNNLHPSTHFFRRPFLLACFLYASNSQVLPRTLDLTSGVGPFCRCTPPPSAELEAGYALQGEQGKKNGEKARIERTPLSPSALFPLCSPEAVRCVKRGLASSACLSMPPFIDSPPLFAASSAAHHAHARVAELRRARAPRCLVRRRPRALLARRRAAHPLGPLAQEGARPRAGRRSSPPA